MAGKSKRTIGQLVQCTKCGEWKVWQPGVFKAEKGKPRQPCVICDTKRRSLHAKENIERERRSARIRTAAYRRRHPDRVLEQNRRPRKFNKALANARVRRWKKANPQAGMTAYYQRRDMKQRLPKLFTKTDWEHCLDYWNRRCCVCGREAGDGYALAQEHWIAISDLRQDNPGTVPWNILPLCHAKGGVEGGCNNSKWTRDPVEWLTQFLGPEKAAAKLAEISAYFSSVDPAAVQP